MAALIDSTLWVDYFRVKTPVRIKEQIVAFIDDAEATICEPVRFEILAAALRRERKQIEETFLTMPLLPAPTNMWQAATVLGQQCIDRGVQPRSLDLLIAVICSHHNAELITFDRHFADIAKVSPLRVRLLSRAV